jgi:hypothetical protein
MVPTSCETLVGEARHRWLQSLPSAPLTHVEHLLRLVLTADGNFNDSNDVDIKNERSVRVRLKRQRTDISNQPEAPVHRLASECLHEATNLLALLLCQSGRAAESIPLLESQGYVCRISPKILNYSVPILGTNIRCNKNQRVSLESNDSCTLEYPPCLLYDNFLTHEELHFLQSIFADPSASYWKSHNYTIDPPSPYFSYVVPLCDLVSLGSFGQLLDRTFKFLMRTHSSCCVTSRLCEATHVEMWAHNRPHASGHQLHFDSDNEGQDRIRHPIVSVVYYLSVPDGGACNVDQTGQVSSSLPQRDDIIDIGGPTLVTNQRLAHQSLATKGWLCHPKLGRLLVFDGKYLHCVLPGRQFSQSDLTRSSFGDNVPGLETKEHCPRRVTLMLAFWKGIRIRPGEQPGAARPFPSGDETPNYKEPEWMRQMRTKTVIQMPSNRRSDSRRSLFLFGEVKRVEPIAVKPVYETVHGEPWTRKMGKPNYESIFQGF